MNAITTQIVDDLIAKGDRRFRNMQLPGANFRGRDLRNADFRGASLPGCDFTDADLTHANMEGANCYGADFTRAKCYRTNFKDAQLSESIMHASDLYGATFTLCCQSFKGMKVLPGWWYGWLFYGLLMVPPSKDAEEKLIALMGVERYSLLRTQYASRTL